MAQEIADSTLLDTWASSGLKVKPDISKIIEGWQLGEQPPHEYMNWLQNTFGSKLNHILKNGVASWNNETEYLSGATTQHNGSVWKCKTTNTNSEPTELNNNWEKIPSLENLALTVDTIYDLPTSATTGDTCIVKDLDRGGIFVYDSTKVSEDNQGTNFNGWVRQYSGAVNVKWFGAKGDGVTDDTMAIQDSLALKGEITGEGTYKTSQTLVLDSNTILKNIKINSSATIVFSATGTENGYVSLTANAINDSFSCTVSNVSSFVVDGWAFIKSNEYWSISDNVKMGEYVKIQNIIGNVLYFYDSIVGTYFTSDSASISPVVHKENIQFNNVSINGDVLTDNQQALKFTLCKDIIINNLKSKDFDYIHINFDRCVNYIVDGGESSKTGVQEGLDYGVGHLRGCYNGKVVNYTGNAMRHISTIGGSEGISRFITVDKCFGYSLTDAGIDAHSAVYEHQFINNFLSFDDDDVDTTIDGIISNGGKPLISNNTIVNCRRHGVLWQPLIKQTNAKIKGIISNIDAKGSKLDTTTYLINVTGSSTTGETKIDGCNISTVNGIGFNGAVLIETNISEINNIIITSANTSDSASIRGIIIDASKNNVNNIIINGCNLENVSSENIYLFGSTTYGVRDINISGNILKGGNIGIRGVNAKGGKISNNLIKGYSSAKFLFDASSNISIDKGVTKIQTGSPTYTLLTHETDFIYNRTATGTITLPDPTVNEDMEIRMSTIKPYAVNSASANVVPITDTSAGTAILPATAGAWCVLKSNGTNWVTIQRG